MMANKVTHIYNTHTHTKPEMVEGVCSMVESTQSDQMDSVQQLQIDSCMMAYWHTS